MELLLSQLSGKDITELIAAGREKFASVPCGGGGVAVAAAGPAAGGGSAPAAEAKKEEQVEEKEESDDVRSLFTHSFFFPITIRAAAVRYSDLILYP
jgi:ribosomal protein L12E/L44/L45/RPP1/RPP2